MDDHKHNYPTKVSLILRMVVSVYLLYLVWELREAPASHTGVESLLFIAAMVLFTAVAVILGGLSLRAFLRGEYGHPEDGDDSKSRRNENHYERRMIRNPEGMRYNYVRKFTR